MHGISTLEIEDNSFQPRNKSTMCFVLENVCWLEDKKLRHPFLVQMK